MTVSKIIPGLALLAATTAGAQTVPITFSGTAGSSPVSITFDSNVSFTLTNSATAGDFLLFTMADLFPTNGLQQHFVESFSSVLQYSINGGPLQSVTGLADDGWAAQSITANDGYFWFNAPEDLNPGDVITLDAGTLTSEGNVPANFNIGTTGNYNMFIGDAGPEGRGGLDISNFGATSAPEPSSLALAALGGLGGLTWFRRRNK